jgi:hypothetical protein
MNSAFVMPGLDPGIQADATNSRTCRLDCRVKPGNDGDFLNHFVKSLNPFADGRLEVTETAFVFAAGARR